MVFFDESSTQKLRKNYQKQSEVSDEHIRGQKHLVMASTATDWHRISLKKMPRSFDMAVADNLNMALLLDQKFGATPGVVLLSDYINAQYYGEVQIDTPAH